MRWSAVAFVVASACSAPEPVPTALAGTVPSTVLLLPTIDHVGQRDVALELDTTLYRVVVERGYYPVPVEVGIGVLRECGVAPDGYRLETLPLERLRDFGVAAVLGVEVIDWTRAESAAEVAHHLLWTMIDTASGKVIWSYDRRGEAGGRVRQVLRGPFFSDEPILGRDFESWVKEEEIELSDPALVAGMQERMARYLPPGPHVLGR